MARIASSRKVLLAESSAGYQIDGAEGYPSTDRRHRPPPRKGKLCRRSRLLWAGLALVAFTFFVLGAWQISLTTGTADSDDVPSSVGGGRREATPVGGLLRFVPMDLTRRFEDRRLALNRRRSERRHGFRPPRLALSLNSGSPITWESGLLVMQNVHDSKLIVSVKRYKSYIGLFPKCDAFRVTKDACKTSHLLMLVTLVKSLMDLGYKFMVFVPENNESRFLWKNVGCEVSVLNYEHSVSIDWSTYEGVIVSSIEGRKVIPRLMQEPFMSVPLVWLVHEDILGKRLSNYAELGWHELISEWRQVFARADLVVFPDPSLAMLYSMLDNGNFYVISGYPIDLWATNNYIESHSSIQLRKEFEFLESDLLILVIGDYFIYDELPWVSMLQTLMLQVKRTRYLNRKMKFIVLCGDSTLACSSTFQEVASRMAFPDGSLRHYDMDHDMRSLLLMVDIVLYWSFNAEQSFPPLLQQAMAFEIPVVAPNMTVIEKYVTDSVHGVLFHPSIPDTLDRAFSLLIEDEKLSNLAHYVASHGKLLAMNMHALECVAGYAQLLENVLLFPSDTLVPQSSSQNQQNIWLWDVLDREFKQTNTCVEVSDGNKDSVLRSSIVHVLEEEFSRRILEKSSQLENGTYADSFTNGSDWNNINEIQAFEDSEGREIQELDERMESPLGSWEDVYRNARKSEKQKGATYERDEGELERTGQPLSIYEVYSGEGAWPFLHHGSIYRGLALSYSGRRSNSDDINAVKHLPILNDSYYKDILCEIGAMFAVANRVDSIHKLPWIGFQSWRASGRRVSLSRIAERVLEKTIQEQSKGDVIYYWAAMDMVVDKAETNGKFDFWSICDHLNAAQCRVMFADAFRQMYGLPPDVPVLPPMPSDGGHWSILHSWVMPTPSFLEFVMFARMFADSLDSLNQNSRNLIPCVLGSSDLERRHCYCRVLEVLVNVWAYHSARRMVYLHPLSGELNEQHPIELREMWVKYFNLDLLKSMDGDLAEKADDGMHQPDRWLWPLTGEIQWQGILDREREERLKQKMDKKKKMREKLLERHKLGYKQKSLGQKEKSE